MGIIDQFFFAILNHTDFREVGKQLKKLKESEDWDQERLKKLQLEKLILLLSEAKKYVPYWRELLSDNDEYKSKTSVEEILKHFPVLTKKIIRENGEKIWSENIAKYIVATTGGTTGHPLTIRRDYSCNAITKAALWRGRISWGMAPSVKTLYLNSFGKGTFLGRTRLKLANKLLGEAFPSSNEDVDLITKQITRFKPKALEGFATGLLETVARASTNDRIKIPAIVSTGEMLYPYQRELLEKHYSGQLYTYYGSNEIGSIGFECEHKKLHICEEHVIVETVDDDGNPVMNKPGRVLVTDLDNMAMPFIRYELGDIAVISDEFCTCGRKSNVISELIGRNQDFLSGQDGKRLQATQLAGYLKDLMSTGQLQFIQDDESQIVILYDGVKSEAISELELIRNHLFDRLGSSISVEFKNVKAIQKTNRGKQPLVIRKLKK